MSQTYNLEPPTKGSVVLHTTHGDIEVELWPNEAPKAVRNFAQLCMEGYYDKTIFHRVIKDFMVQGGDPTGSGTGGESVYGRPFKSEFHSRLRFQRRGIVACANVSGEADTNGSQFFITVERADHLNRQCTIFGCVSNDTVFTALRIADVEVDEQFRPVDAPRVLSTEVLLPPFDDIVPRSTPAERAAAAAVAAEAKRLEEVRQRRQRGVKKAVLSFGDDLEEDDEELVGVHVRCAHETMVDDPTLQAAKPGTREEVVQELQQRLKQEAEVRAGASRAAADTRPGDQDRQGTGAPGPSSFEQSMHARLEARKAAMESRLEHAGASERASPERPSDEAGGGRDGERGVANAAEAAKEQKKAEDAKLKAGYKATLAKFQRGRKSGDDREKDTMAKLKRFMGRVKEEKRAQKASLGTRTAEAAPAGEAAVRREKVAYDGKVDETMDHRTYLPAAWRLDKYLEGPDDDLGSLIAHKFAWDEDDVVANPNARRDDTDDYVVMDPLMSKDGKSRYDQKQQRANKRKLEWAGAPNV